MRDEEFLEGLDPDEHPLQKIYPICLRIYRLFEKSGKTDVFGSSDTIERLHVNDDTSKLKKAYACRTIANILAVLMITLILTVILCVKESRNHVLNDGQLSRAPTGSGMTDYNLTAVNSDTGEELDMTVSVGEQRCAEEELDQYFDTAFDLVPSLVLGEGNSADCVTGDIRLIKEIPGTSVKVSWPELDHAYIFSDGTIRRDVIDEPTIITLMVRLEYYGESRIYTFPIRLMPRGDVSEESFQQKLAAALKEEEENSGKARTFRLPTKVDGVEVRWHEKRNTAIILIPVLGVIAALAVIPGAKDELNRKEKLRSTQMLRDYPDLISKYVLLLGAGMTCRGAWEKICRDYVRMTDENSKHEKHYAYEEMLRSGRELRLGIAEARVYEEFGRRTGVTAYRRFGTLLASNLRRGSSDIVNMLERESQEAFAERKNDVRMRAEEAGTKLLFPMLGMLCIVIAIVVVPAFTSFAG